MSCYLILTKCNIYSQDINVPITDDSVFSTLQWEFWRRLNISLQSWIAGENQKWPDENISQINTYRITYPEHDSPKYKIQSSVNNQHKWVKNDWMWRLKKNEPSVNVNTFMSTGHRDGQCNLRPDGDKLNFGFKKKSASCETWTTPAAKFTWEHFRGKRIIKWLILTMKQYQFKSIWIFADCTLNS